jgi:hypothetical protein
MSYWSFMGWRWVLMYSNYQHLPIY